MEGRPAKSFPSDHGVAEDHEEAADDAKVAQEEVEVEDQSVAEALDDNNTQEASDREFGVSLENDHGRTAEHGDNVDDQE